MGGDVTGPSTNATVVKIRNVPVAAMTPGVGQNGYGLKYDHAQGQMVLGPVATTGNSISNLLIISNTAASTDVEVSEIGMYGTLRPGDLPSMVLNVGGYEAAYVDLLGITLQSGGIHLLSDFMDVNVAAYDGTVTAPAYTWDEDRDLGKYRISYGGDYGEGFCVNSNLVWFWAADGIHMTNGKSIFGLPYAAQIGSNAAQIASLQLQVSSNDADIATIATNAVAQTNLVIQQAQQYARTSVSNWYQAPALAAIIGAQDLDENDGNNVGLIGGLSGNDGIIYFGAVTAPAINYGPGIIGISSNFHNGPLSPLAGNLILFAGGYEGGTPSGTYGKIQFNIGGSVSPIFEGVVTEVDTNGWNFMGRNLAGITRLQGNGTVLQLGSGASNCLDITNNAIRFRNTYFDDVTIPATSLGNNTNNSTTFNSGELAWQLENNSQTNAAGHTIFGTLQLSHRYKPGTPVDFHCHWYQPTVTNANYTNFWALMRWNHNGQAPGAWVRYHGTNVYGGNTGLTSVANSMQITDFGCPPGYTNANFSSILDVKLEYNGALGHDVPLLIKALDAHMEIDRIGTDNEYD